jgi:predicted metal-binding membrane protein
MERVTMSPTVAAAGGPGDSAAALRSAQIAVIAVLFALAAVAWVITDLRMAGMDAGPGTDPGALGFYITTWVVMMAAMMFPSIAPMVLTYRNVQRGRRAHGVAVAPGTTTLFVGGYLIVWGVSGLIAYAILKGGRALDGGLFAWSNAGRWTAAAVLIAAAVYEFTPAKRACLTRCRSPLGFLVGSWRDGRDGALRMGFEHGAWCIGCCWALMAALFALGAMSLTWMLVIGALIAVEKLLPWERSGTVGVGVVLAALGIGIAVAPAQVPALTVPGSPTAMRAMESMGEMAKPHAKGAMTKPRSAVSTSTSTSTTMSMPSHR